VTLAEPEAGVTGCAMIAARTSGAAADWADARTRVVAFEAEIEPNPEWRDCYLRQAEVFDALYAAGPDLWNLLVAMPTGS